MTGRGGAGGRSDERPGTDHGRGVTVVVPVYGSTAALEPLVERLHATFDGVPLEVLVIDDGSPGDSWEAIERLAAHRPGVRGLRLRTNQGQGVAVATAFGRSRGRILVTIDADLDSYPEDLPALVAAAEEHGFAIGVRSGRRQLLRAVASHLFNLRIRRLGYDLHDVGCGSLAARAELGSVLASLGDEQRNIRYKLALYRLAGGAAERPVRSTRTNRSSYRWRDLAAIWAEVERDVAGSPWGEVAFGWLGLPRPTSPAPEVIGDTGRSPAGTDPG